MHDPVSGVKFANNEPWRPFFKTSQINIFNEDHRGDGVQHVAMTVADIVTAGSTLFNPNTDLGKQYREGYMGRTAGFDFMENTLWPSHARSAANPAASSRHPSVIRFSHHHRGGCRVGAGRSRDRVRGGDVLSRPARRSDRRLRRPPGRRLCCARWRRRPRSTRAARAAR